MTEKQRIKRNLLICFLMLLLTVIVRKGILILKRNNEKTIETQKVIEVQANSNSLNDVLTNDTAQEEYEEVLDKLDYKDDIFFVTNANKNSDGTYTLKGVEYTKFTLTKDELENAANNGGYEYFNTYYTIKKDYHIENSNFKYKYAFIKKFNNEERVAFFTVKKDDNTYYIQNPTECCDEWKITSNFRRITVSADTEVELAYDEISNVKNYFDNYKEQKAVDTSHPTGCFTLEFTNGKCSKIFEYVTGH